MRNERKYKIISLLTSLLAILLLGNCFREYYRMESATQRQSDEYVLAGAKIYAQNCMQCHGPKGEGVTGMPLNRKALQVDPTSPAGKETYNMVYNTLLMGRKGNDSHFQWEKTADGYWISYSTMPAWGKEYGGPLDSEGIKALTLFIVNPDPERKQWDLVGTSEAPPQAADLPKDYSALSAEEKVKQLPLPNAQVDAATNASAQTLLRNLGKSQCLTCHTIGAKGGKIGPDLSKVGAWGVDQKFLEDWIKYANRPGPNDQDQTPAMAHDKRMPVYWSASRASITPSVRLGKEHQVLSEGPYSMPRFKGKLSDEEISILAKYLMGLK